MIYYNNIYICKQETFGCSACCLSTRGVEKSDDDVTNSNSKMV